MTQTVNIRQHAAPCMNLEAINEAVVVPQAGNTTLLTIQTYQLKRLFVEITVAAHALDAFIVSAKPTPAAPAVIIANAGGDFTAPTGLMIGASGDLTTQAVGTGWFLMDVEGLAEVIIQASSGNAAGSTVTAYAGGS